MSIEQMASASHAIVVAEVVSVKPVSLGTTIVTRVRLDVERVLAGTSPARVEITLPGGSIGEKTVYVTDVPSFAPGERVVVFLGENGEVIGGTPGRLGVRGGRVVETGETVERLQGRLLAGSADSATRRAFPEMFGLADDDGTVAPLATTAAGPTIDTISPSAAPAGTGDTIKILGSGFGTTKGSVEFYYRGTTPIVANGTKIKSWSDTLIETEVPVGPVNDYAASAGSGPMRVVTSGGTKSADRTFTVTFGYGGAKWAASPSFKIYANSSDTADESALVQAGANAWNNRANFSLTYAGGTTSPALGNNVNEVWWSSLPVGVIGQATYYYEGSTLVEADVRFTTSDPEVTWGDGTGGTFDLQSVATHEFGHWLTLRDLYGSADSTKVMYGMIGAGQQRRTPSASDHAGISYIYGDGVPYEEPEPAKNISVSRVAGTTRYRTAVAISAANFAAGTAPTAVLATGAQFADALSASGLAGAYGGPLLLSETNAIDPLVLAELDRLGTRTVVIVGGPSAVSVAVESRLRGAGYKVDRIAGSNRYATSSAIATRIASLEGSDFVGEAFLARGDQFADALAAAPYAYARKMPVLLTDPAALSPETRNAVRANGIDRVFVAGGTSAVSNGAVAQLGVPAVRVSGSNRYATAAALVRNAVDRSWCTPTFVGVSTGENFPDALGGGVAVGANGGAVVLTTSKTLNPSAAVVLSECTSDLERVQVFGGQGAVSDSVLWEIQALWP
jgi:putative cell wall-binding protein